MMQPRRSTPSLRVLQKLGSSARTADVPAVVLTSPTDPAAPRDVSRGAIAATSDARALA